MKDYRITESYSALIKRGIERGEQALILPVTFYNYNSDGSIKQGALPEPWRLSVGKLHGISSATSHGKTLLLKNICLWTILNTDHPVLYFSQEATAENVFWDFLDMQGVDSDELREAVTKRPKSTDKDIKGLTMMQAIESGTLDIRMKTTPEDMKATIRAFKGKHEKKYPVILIDNLPLIAFSDEEVGRATRGLHQVAAETDSIIIVTNWLKDGNHLATMDNDETTPYDAPHLFHTHVLLYMDNAIEEHRLKHNEKEMVKFKELRARKNNENFVSFGEYTKDVTRIYLNLVRNKFGQSLVESCIRVDHTNKICLDGIVNRK